jgi:RNA polymerase sigma-70 factor (ECF subfamily)
MTYADPAEASLHRDHLLRFARRRLRDPALAEDVVHDVLAAVCEGRARFERRSGLRTWLVGILKHKIVDAVRRRAGECSLDALADEQVHAEPMQWRGPESDEPSRAAEQRQRLRAALARIALQPEPLRRTFEMHVLQGEDAQQVCEALAISRQNLWVRVHRVRRELRPLAAG